MKKEEKKNSYLNVVASEAKERNFFLLSILIKKKLRG